MYTPGSQICDPGMILYKFIIKKLHHTSANKDTTCRWCKDTKLDTCKHCLCHHNFCSIANARNWLYNFHQCHRCVILLLNVLKFQDMGEHGRHEHYTLRAPQQTMLPHHWTNSQSSIHVNHIMSQTLLAIDNHHSTHSWLMYVNVLMFKFMHEAYKVSFHCVLHGFHDGSTIPDAMCVTNNHQYCGNLFFIIYIPLNNFENSAF